MSEENIIKIKLNPNLYSLTAIQSTAYVFVDKTYIYLDEEDEKICVFLTPKNEINNKEKESLKGEFLNELLNYSLREKLTKENKKIRELIIERALYSSVSEEDIWLEK